MNSDAYKSGMRGLSVLKGTIQPVILRSVAAVRLNLLLAGPQLSLERLAKYTFSQNASESELSGNGP